jgi:hypothetical protein
VSELPLNDDERHAFASHLDGVGGATGVERTFDEHPQRRRCAAAQLERPRSTTSDHASGR